jgi:hypothetical protein
MGKKKPQISCYNILQHSISTTNNGQHITLVLSFIPILDSCPPLNIVKHAFAKLNKLLFHKHF